MAIRPHPIKLTCLHCSKSRVIQYRSDAISIPMPINCDHCDGGELKRTAANALDVVKAKLTGRYFTLV